MTIPLGCALLRTSTRPTRTTARKPALRHNRSYSNGRPYLVLLQVGFTLPPLLPKTRCALTAPFHPYRQKSAVCFLWHFPWGYPRRTLSGTLLPWSPDFPLPCESSHPAIWRGPTMRADPVTVKAPGTGLLTSGLGKPHGHSGDPAGGLAVQNTVRAGLAVTTLKGRDHIRHAGLRRQNVAAQLGCQGHGIADI